MILKTIFGVIVTFFMSACASIKDVQNGRAPSSADSEVAAACEKAAKSRLRYYKWEYIYSDCLAFVSPKISSEQILACSDVTSLTSGFFECLRQTKEQKIDITSAQIRACGSLVRIYDVGIGDYCISVITENLSVQKILDCKTPSNPRDKNDVRTCLVRNANE